tara:strand:+ start:277 stop:504 length:228 start_codon:yes stop_codon:yes gene_type:complete
MDEKYSIKLGEDQIKWKNKFGDIDLSQWRLENISKDKSEWLYIGDWMPDNSNVYQSYWERRENLANNRYYYWPNK